MGEETQSHEAALERFIVANDDLLELEELIGRFNIFDALKLARVEIRHSNFLAWLLDPAESHGQGDLFLRSFLTDVLSMAPSDNRPFSPLELDGISLQEVEVRREWKHIDLLILSKSPSFAVIIENKIDSGEHDSQLIRYEKTVADNNPTLRQLCVFLTVDGDVPSNGNYVTYTYADLFRVLTRCRRTFAGSIGSDVAVILDHYLRLIGSRFMNDDQINELCRRIYKNHRQALDLIYENAGSPAAGLVGEIADVLKADPYWKLVGTRPKGIDFVPAEWANRFPAIGVKKDSERCWVVLKFRVGERRLTSGASAWKTTSPVFRKRIIDLLTQKDAGFGFRLFSAKIAGERHTEIGGKHVVAEWGDEEPDATLICEAVKTRLNELKEKTSGVLAALEPAFTQFKIAQNGD